jgi:hypothetical protein
LKDRVGKSSWVIFVCALAIGAVLLVLHPSNSELNGNLKSIVSNQIYKIGQSKVSQFISRSVTGDQSLLLNQEPLFVPQDIIVETGILFAFTDQLVYQKGEKPKLFIRGKGNFQVNVYNFSNSKRNQIQKFDGSLNERGASTFFNTFKGFEKTEFDSFTLNIKESIGWIQIQVRASGKVLLLPIFLEEYPRNDVLFVESTDTIKAYVSGASMRTFYARLPMNIVGEFTRPFAYPTYYEIKHWSTSPEEILSSECTDHLINADFVLKDQLERIGINHSVVSDEFLDRDVDLSLYRMIVLGTHNEYWSSKKINRIMEYVEQGGSLLILGGNTAWRQIARGNDFDYLWGEGILSSNPGYENYLKNLLGSYYDISGYDTYAPFKLLAASRLLNEDSIIGGSFGVGTNFDVCEGKIAGASGHETDKLYGKSNGFTVIAKGLNGDGNGGAEIVYKHFESSGGQVLNFGSLSLWHRIDDSVIQKLILNFDKFARN